MVKPLFSSRRLKVKSALKIKRKIRSKLGVSTRVLNLEISSFLVKI